MSTEHHINCFIGGLFHYNNDICKSEYELKTKLVHNIMNENIISATIKFFEGDANYSFLKDIGKNVKKLELTSINGVSDLILSKIEYLYVEHLIINELTYLSKFKNIKIIECEGLDGYDGYDAFVEDEEVGVHHFSLEEIKIDCFEFNKIIINDIYNCDDIDDYIEELEKYYTKTIKNRTYCFEIIPLVK